MIATTADDKISDVLRRALADTGIVNANDTSLIFHDVSALEARFRDLQAQFPSNALHAVAIKANPLLKVLAHLVQMGAGLEAASLPELRLGEHAGATESRLVFDSPVKTVDELQYAMQLGCHINADSIYELDRIAQLIDSQGVPLLGSAGVRINPQVGVGTISMTSVAARYSKFGVGIGEHHDELLDRFLRYEWLSGVHLHIGSQGCAPEMLVAGVEIVLNFVNEVNDTLHRAGLPRRITTFDLGGGLPVSYHRDVAPYSMEQYAKKLRERCPQLFDQSVRLITEFGRYLHANTGWVATKVEYVKRGRDAATAMVHVGADLFLRECYAPNDWHHDITVADSSGRVKVSDAQPYVVAGPLCFAGDILARDLTLPRLDEGDYLIVRDTGAYTLSMWSRYNSRQIPKVIGYRAEGEELFILRERETVEDILNFWS